jgi:hypothetical protein
MLVKT